MHYYVQDYYWQSQYWTGYWDEYNYSAFNGDPEDPMGGPYQGVYTYFGPGPSYSTYSTNIIFGNTGAGSYGDCEVPTVTITKANGSNLPSPFRLGISGGGNDRKQSLKATVDSAELAQNVTIQVSDKITLSNLQRNGEVITFDVVGNSASSNQDDSTIIAKYGGGTVTTKKVSVVVPSKIATPHDITGTYLAANRVLDSTTSPAFLGLAEGRVALTTIYCRTLTILVKDQFNTTIGDVYLNATITETLGGSNVPINQLLTSGSTYSDPVCQVNFVNDVLSGSASATSWPSQSLVPMQGGSGTQNIPVQLDGFNLSPAVINRVWTATPPETFTISWPN